MKRKRLTTATTLALVLILGLALVGVGYGLWFKVLFIEGTVVTGDLNAQFRGAFTNDDNKMDDPDLDEADTGDCRLPVGSQTSCDPRAGGPNAPRYDKDVGQCFAGRTSADDDRDQDQPGIQTARVLVRNGYPSYWCTAWLEIHNNGSIPVYLHSIDIEKLAGARCPDLLAYDLSGDGAPDAHICASGFEPPSGTPEVQIDPGQSHWIDLWIHIMQPAPQGETLLFDAQVCLHQWNEEGQCDRVE